MEIISITENHVDDCVKVFVDAYNSPPWNCNWTAEKAGAYLSELINNTNFIGFIVYENDNAVAAILGHKKTWWTNDQLMVDELFVSKSAQKKGYGKKLMSYCEEYAKENQIELLALMTNKYLPAFDFYENLDFIAADQYVFMFKQL
jgi:N-acetylglutamate synthase-like GNAT family acetyltransferase